MKKNEIKVGGHYTAKVNGVLTTVKVTGIRDSKGYRAGKSTDVQVYDVLNTRTGRTTTFHSAAKFRGVAKVEVMSGEVSTLRPLESAELGERFLKQSTIQPIDLPEMDKQIDAYPLDVKSPTGGQHSTTPMPDNEPAVEISEEARANEARRQKEIKEYSKTLEFVGGGVMTEKPGKFDSVVGGHMLEHKTIPPKPSAFGSKFAIPTSSDSQAPHLIIVARAGTGKTFTLVEGLKKIFGLHVAAEPSPQQAAVWEAMLLEKEKPRTSCFAAFNTTIAAELGRRIPKQPGCVAKTLHGLGYYAIRKAFHIRQDPSDGRVNEIVSEIMRVDLRELRRERPVLVKAVDQLVGLCKLNLINPGDYSTWVSDDPCPDPAKSNSWPIKMSEIAAHYDIELGDPATKKTVFELIPAVLERCKDVAKDGYVDFNDMIWIPVILGLPVFKNDLMLVDEFQDTNRCQQEFAKMAGRRLILCGDPQQAIYGFAGADSDGMKRMQKDLEATPRGCKILQLTVTRRCGKAIVVEAQQLVKDFEAHEANPPGIVTEALYPMQPKRTEAGRAVLEEIPYEKTYLPLVQDGDMILCRANGPLVNNCFRFIKRGRRATIQGRNIGDSLIALVEKLDALSVQDLLQKLGDWLVKEQQKENGQRNPSQTKLQAMQDKHDCLVAFADACKEVHEITLKIQTIFTDDPNVPGIKFSSIHRAKGLEAKRVFYIQGFGRPEDKMKLWELEQEKNLRYVAITRAIHELCMVY